MREILFRGKAEIGSNWVYGDLIHRLGGATIGAVDSDGLHELYVNEDTVGQYTGLQDKNGVKIFEGDIIKDTTDNELLTVEGATTFGFDFKYVAGEDEYVTAFDIGIDDDNTYLISSIVIGNIHDNPELLEV
ncbi:MAG: YopX family protein [Lachnospirales bacterium]